MDAEDIKYNTLPDINLYLVRGLNQSVYNPYQILSIVLISLLHYLYHL